MNRTVLSMSLIAAALVTAAPLHAVETDSRPAAAASRPAGGPASRPATTVMSTAGDSATAVGDDSPAVPDSSLVFRLEIGNRMYPEWKDEQRVHLEEPFHLGDTDFWAAPRVFLPDFRLGEDGATSVSRKWNNPAVSVIVFQDSVPVDSTWAFRDFPPHFSARSFFTFKLLEILTPELETDAR